MTMKNRFGNIFSVTTFGESHGPAIGGVIDGMPAGIKIDTDAIQHELDRRRPGQSDITSGRNEKDRVEILSGLYEGVTTGQPIGFIVRNNDARSADYDQLRDIYRPSHADYTYTAKYGIRDHRGGGRSSARETVSRVVAGAFARQALATVGIKVNAYTSQIGDIRLNIPYNEINTALTDTNDVRCPDPAIASRMHDLIMKIKKEGDTVGGIVTGVITGCQAGLGEPAFGKLHATLAAAMMSINAAKGFDYGMGFDGARMRGSETIDRFIAGTDRKITTVTNNSGGIQGGISNGEDIYFRVAFKPVATLMQEIETVDRNGNKIILSAKGRHDPCVVPRAVPVVEAMAAITVLDAWLSNRTIRMI